MFATVARNDGGPALDRAHSGCCNKVEMSLSPQS
jgi:hypothetical protein